MKRLLLLSLATVPLFAFTVNFIYCDYEEDWGEEYWCEEYWEPEPYWYDAYWVYYPPGYYCVYYVWYHPWWWDWYWWRCHWCHHFDWHFFCAGFYVVWYEDGCWWFRPRYGRWVRYKLPYTYQEFRYKARVYGIELPEKITREITLPYKEKEIQRLVKEKDPQLYTRLKREYKSGNLEKMQREYVTRMEREIQVKNEEYQRTKGKTNNLERVRGLKSEEGIEKRTKGYISDKERIRSKENENRIIKKRKIETKEGERYIDVRDDKGTKQKEDRTKIKDEYNYQRRKDTEAPSEKLSPTEPSGRRRIRSQTPQKDRS